MAIKIHSIRAWLLRRTVKGIVVNADAHWAYIKRRWPTLSEEEREYLFQHS
jgi:hypothetical protein